MNCSRMILLCVCFAGLTPFLWSQNGNHVSRNDHPAGVLGYLDPQTGAFRPVHRHAGKGRDGLEPGTVTITGKFVFNFTITLDSAVPSGDAVGCAAGAQTYDETRETDLDESGFAQATITGSTASCTVSLPYSWLMASPSEDTVRLNSDVFIFNPTNNGLNLDGYFTRYSLHTINPDLAVPPSGQTTTVPVAATI